MGFLKQEDYLISINRQLLDMLLDGEADKLTIAEDDAEGYIRDQLSGRYDMQFEFTRTGHNRNKRLLIWMRSLAIYYLHNTVADTEIPERVAKNYDDARKEIDAVCAGKKQTTLTPLIEGGKKKTRFRWGSSPKRSHNPY